MQSFLKSRKFTRLTAMFLAVVLLCLSFDNLTMPSLSVFAENETKPYVVLDGEKVSEVTLEDDAKLRFEAISEEENASFLWQIADPADEGRFVNIADGYSKYLWVTHALVGSMLATDNTARLRCRVQVGEKEAVYTDPVTVTLSLSVTEDYYYSAPTVTTRQARRFNAENTEHTTHTIVINYLFDNNAMAFEPYGASIAAGSDFKASIKSPEVVGYAPFRRVGNDYVDATTVDFDLKNVTENITINVIYEPALVKYSVHHHLQNILDDEYSVHYDLITTGMALTGSTVGDGLALNEEQLPGFKPLAYEKLTVAADGSTVIEIRYDRNYYLIDFDMNGGYGTEPVYTRYGATVGANNPIRHGYIFDGWELVSYGDSAPTPEQQSLYTLSQDRTISVPAANLRYKARWITQETTYTMVFWCENAENNDYTYWGYLDNLPAMSGSFVDGKDYISRVAGIDDEQYFTFNEAKTDKNVLVEGDGSTVVNVYYTRNYYKLTFKATGKCTIEANHTHGDECYDIICGMGHTHNENCVPNLVCTNEEHTAHDESCIVCGKVEHTHGQADCSCKKDEHKHTTACWKNVGSVQSNTNGYPKNPQDGQIYRKSAAYYIHIGGIWYRYTTWGVSSGDIVDPSCGKTDHTHGTDCSCNITPHTHNDTCYKDLLHTHGEACYKYSCGTIEHTHSDKCYRLKCGTPENHTHTTNCNSSTRTNTVKTVYAKYRQSLKDKKIWPVTDDNGKEYNSGERWSPSDTTLYTQVLVYIDEMPADDFTLTVNTSTNSTYTMNYYQQVLPGQAYDVSYSGNYYKLYTQIKANYGKVTKAEDFFPLKGYYQFGSNPAFSGDSITINSGSKIVNFYYNRIVDHYITYNNNGIMLNDKAVSNVMYGAPLKDYNFTPDYPANLEPNAYTFEGWYISPGCFDGTEMDWENDTMPEGDLMLYAKWAPITHRVRVFKEANLKEQIGADQIVDHKAFAVAPEGNIVNGNYVFQGWFYKDYENGKEVEKAFSFSGIPILDDMDIYAKWSSHVSVNYKIYYKLKTTGEEIADPTVGSAIAGHNKTFDAKAGDQLYPAFQSGYYPLTNSHTITMSVDGTHEFTFEYVFVESMPYRVQYINKETGEKLTEEDKVVMDNTLSVVTETFKQFDKMMPDAYQKRLVLSADKTDNDGDGIFDANVITFYYQPDEVHAYYRVVHHIQNIHGDTYREYRSEEFVGIIGEDYTVNALTLTGFAYQPQKTTQDGHIIPSDKNSVTTTLGSEGMLIELFYDRLSYNYTVRYINNRTHSDLVTAKVGSGVFGEQVVEYARNLENMGYELVSDSTKSLTLSANEEHNVIEFLYQERNVSIRYEIVGPENCGVLSQYGENITAITGDPNGSTPTANKGFVFLGWYTDKSCTQPVNKDWINPTTNYLDPEKTASVWSNLTFYAKFATLETDLTITTRGSVSADPNQTFIFRIKGTAGTDTANIDLTVAVIGNSSVTVAKLPTGNYTVTELSDWSWRYAVGQKEVNLALEYNDGANQLIFEHNRINTKWLDGNTVKNNLFK